MTPKPDTEGRKVGALGRYCPACEAIPTQDYCRLAGCPMRPEDPPCTDCGGTGITYQTERRCACTLTDEERQAWQDIRDGMNR